MQIVWTTEALEDLENIVVYYYEKVGSATAAAIETRVTAQIATLKDFPERIRASDCVPGARELVIQRLPYIVFVRIGTKTVQVLNVVHMARKFPP